MERVWKIKHTILILRLYMLNFMFTSVKSAIKHLFFSVVLK